MNKSLLKQTARQSQRGMSLIEIVVVLAIIGILATVIARSVFGYLDSSKQDTTRLTMSQINTALVTYKAKKNKFPSSLDKVKPFMDGDIPKDAWGNEFEYSFPAQGCKTKYELKSLGADGKSGGEDFDADLSSCDTEEE